VSNLRRSISWPPGLLESALALSGPDLSSYVVGCALGVMTDADRAEVRRVADLLHTTVKAQMTKRIQRAGVARQRDRGKAERDPVRELNAEIDLVKVGEGVQFELRPVFLRADNLAPLNEAASAAGFLRLDQQQPTGSPLASGQHARSFVAFLRAATAVEVERQ
jgi:hypothetical protein